MNKAVFAGSFDPFTNGHRDIVSQASEIFDFLVIAVGKSASKKSLFSDQEKVDLIANLYKDDPKIEVSSFEGLVVDFAKFVGARCLVRGLRTEADFSYEMPMAMTNHKIAPEIQTIFFPTNPQFAYVSSSLVKELCHHGADISSFVPDEVANLLALKYGKS